MIKKILLTFLVFLLLFTTISVPFAYAQATNPWYVQTYDQWFLKVYDTNISPPQEIFGERYTAAQVTWVIYGLIAFVVNSIGNAQLTTCIFKRSDLNTCLNQNPLFGYIPPSQQEKKSVLATLFPPERQLSGVNYVREKLSTLHVIPQAQAQVGGFGFGALGPVQAIWKTLRDVMYGFFVIIIIIFAFMIMFRTKISPQTVVTIQSAIPKVIISLILVTFSYAIAGFMIDLVYVVIGILALIITKANLIQDGWTTTFNLLTLGPKGLGILGWFYSFALIFVAVLAFCITNIALSLPLLLGLAAGVVTFILTILLYIGIVIWLIITLAKVFILLIKTYISILLSVIFAPFIIGFGTVLPTGGFGGWLRGLLANLAVYPVMGAILMIAILFISAVSPNVRYNLTHALGVTGISDIFNTSSNTQYWYPPLTFGAQSGTWDPLPFLWIFASLGILAMIPKVVDIIKALMSGKGVEGGGGLEAFGPAKSIGTALGIYGLASYVTGKETAAMEKKAETPAWTQAVRRITGIKK